MKNILKTTKTLLDVIAFRRRTLQDKLAREQAFDRVRHSFSRLEDQLDRLDAALEQWNAQTEKRMADKEKFGGGSK